MYQHLNKKQTMTCLDVKMFSEVEH